MLQLHVKTNQACIITAGFLHKHSYGRKNFAVVSVNRHKLQGHFVPLARGFVPGPHWGHSPRPHCGPHFPSRNISGTIFSLLIVSRLESTSSRTTCNHGITHPMSPGIIHARIIRRETLWTRNGHADSLAELRTDSGPKCYHLRATAARIALGGRRDCALKRSLACIVSFCSRSSRTSTANRCRLLHNAA